MELKLAVWELVSTLPKLNVFRIITLINHVPSNVNPSTF